MVHVLIVDDERLIQDLFSRYIRIASDRYVLSECITDAANAPLICQNRKIDLVLMDVCTANNSSGLEAAREIKRVMPRTKVVIVTSAPEYRFIEKAKAAGADSFWYKEVSDCELLSVMDRTMNGERIYPEQTPAVSIGLASSSEFTPREMEVLLHLAEGKSTAQIAEDMAVSVPTVNTHITHLKEKTGCFGKTQLAIFASKAKLVLPEY